MPRIATALRPLARQLRDGAEPVETRPVFEGEVRGAYPRHLVIVADLADRGRPSARATLTVEEAAEVLGISRGLGYELVRTGELPSLRLGRRVVIPRRVVDEMLASVCVGSVSDPTPE